MLKKLIIVLTLLMSGSVFADPPIRIAGAPPQAPDLLYKQCVDPLDRQDIRAMSNLCDDWATGQGYNIGIFRPYNANQDGPSIKCRQLIKYPHFKYVYSCLGSPHQEVCLPPC